MDNYGHIILRALQRENKTQSWLAEQLGVKPSTVSDYLKNPTLKTLRKIDRVLPLPDIHIKENTTPQSENVVSSDDLNTLKIIDRNPALFTALLEIDALTESMTPEVRDQLANSLSELFRALLDVAKRDPLAK